MKKNNCSLYASVSETKVLHKSVLFRTVLLVIFSGLSCSLFAAPTTNGYHTDAPNEFWPFQTATIAGSGTDLQKRSPFTNPDQFCKLQEDGIYRMPSIGEFNGFYRNYYGWKGVTATYPPAHWANYFNNDVTMPILSKMAATTTRQVGSLVNEWGTLNNHGNGWDKTGYWMVEPLDAGRQALNGAGITASTTATNSWGVACVTDLVPIPFLNNSARQ